jgi:hypothetical protein
MTGRMRISRTGNLASGSATCTGMAQSQIVAKEIFGRDYFIYLACNGFAGVS